ncbi:MAG: flagellar filament capping protein FliD [Clostridia bacterium]|nr:flagellar filament capping protein FliD [Clostridia bacterium]
MSNGISNMLNNKLRMSGLSSGLDTDSIIQQLMKVERVKVDKVKQNKQTLEWKRDEYREIINLLRGFKDEYFEVLKPTNNFRSPTAFASYDTKSTSESVLTAKAGVGATAGSYDITVNSLAKAASKVSTAQVSGGYSGIEGSAPVDMTKMKQGKEFTLTLDGVTKTIALDQDYTAFTEANFKTELQRLVNSAFGAGKINVTESGGVLKFAPTTLSSNLSLGDSTNTYLGTLGFTNGQTNSISSGNVVDFSGGNFKITIDSGSAISVNVAAAGDLATLVSNINDGLNTALTAAGESVDIQAVEDTANPGKIKFVSLDTSKKFTFTSETIDNILPKLGIASGSSINAMNGTIGYGVSDIGKDFNITLIDADGTTVTKHIELKYDYASDISTDPDGKTLGQVIEEQLGGGAGSVSVAISGGKISFLNSVGKQIKVEKGDAGLKDELGFTTAQTGSSRVSLSSTLEDANFAVPLTFDGGGNLSFEINGKPISASRTETLGTLINRINSSDAGVTLKYDSLNDKFTMETKAIGSTAAINVTNGAGNFFTALKINIAAEARGTNATMDVEDNATSVTTTIERTTNNFTVNGITYDLKSTGTTTLTVGANPDILVDKIKNFVNKYNEVIGKVNGEISEKSNRSYVPLTDEQKQAMSEKDIELWESKAKSGLLRNDSALQRMVSTMRKALYDEVDGVSLSLHQIGITTSSNYKDNGKLIIDEEKLKKAITDDPDKIVELFTKESQYSYSDTAHRSDRYSEEGLGQRLYDILQDNIRLTRDDSGKKGALIEKAGIEGDITELKSLMAVEIQQKEVQISDLEYKLFQKENWYYQRFANMEKLLSQMNAQSGWLSSQMGQG